MRKALGLLTAAAVHVARALARATIVLAQGLVSPFFLAAVATITGVGLVVSGMYVLAGLGWALLAGSAPCLLLAGVLIRGLVVREARATIHVA